MTSSKSKAGIFLLACATIAVVLACSCISFTKAHGGQELKKIDKSSLDNVDTGTETLSLTVNTHGKTLSSYFGAEGDPLTDGTVIELPKSQYTYALECLCDGEPDFMILGIHCFSSSGGSVGYFDCWYYPNDDVWFSGVFLNGRAMPFDVSVDCPEGMNDVDIFWTNSVCPEPGTAISTQFDTNGGVWDQLSENESKSITEHYFSETVLPTTPTKNNKTFLGWFDADGNKIGLDFTRFWDPSYTAKWGVTISYDANGGSGEIDPQTCVENDTLTLSNGNEFSKDDVALLSWNTKPDGSGDEYSLGQEITATDTLTLYAQWSKAPEPTPTPGEDVNTTIPQTGDTLGFAVAVLSVLALASAIVLINSRRRRGLHL